MSPKRSLWPLFAAALFAGELEQATFAARPIVLMHETVAYADAKGKPMKSPEGVACASDGRFVAADTGNSRLLEYTIQGGRVSGGTVRQFEAISSPTRLAYTQKGELWVLDGKSRRLFRVSTAGQLTGPVGITGGTLTAEPAVASFALGPSDEVVVLDQVSSSVLIADASGGVTKQLPVPVEVSLPTAVTVDATSAVYLVDARTSIIYVAGKDAGVFSALTKPLKAQLEFPVYLTSTNPDRTLLVVDQHGSKLALVAPDGTYLGRQLTMGQALGFVYYPAQICMNRFGELFVADRGSHRIQVFKSSR